MRIIRYWLFGSDEARQLLLDRMRNISEEAYCAGWMMGLEIDLRRLIATGDDVARYSDVCTAHDIAELKRLSRRAGGWWAWQGSGPVFVRKREWNRRMAAHA